MSEELQGRVYRLRAWLADVVSPPDYEWREEAGSPAWHRQRAREFDGRGYYAGVWYHEIAAARKETNQAMEEFL